MSPTFVSVTCKKKRPEKFIFSNACIYQNNNVLLQQRKDQETSCSAKGIK